MRRDPGDLRSPSSVFRSPHLISDQTLDLCVDFYIRRLCIVHYLAHFKMHPSWCRISNGHLCNGWSDPLHVWFYRVLVFGVGGSNDTISGSIKLKIAAMTWLDMTEDIRQEPSDVAFCQTNNWAYCYTFLDNILNGLVENRQTDAEAQ